MKKILIILICLHHVLYSQSIDYQTYDYFNLDKKVRLVKYDGDIQKLVFTLTDGLDSDHLKARAFYTWIAENVSYDCKGLKGQKKIDYNPIDVLESRLAVCHGYAELFQFFCEIIDIECRTVIGWTKTTKNDLRKINWNESNHAWNAIKINEKWEFLDVTWGSGYVKGNCNEYVKEFSDVYFLMKPEYMILEHYPENQYWLLDLVISKSDFENLPLFYRHYFELNINDLNQMNKKIKKNVLGMSKFSFRTTNIIESISSQKNILFEVTDDEVNFKIKPKGNYVSLYINNRLVVTYLN